MKASLIFLTFVSTVLATPITEALDPKVTSIAAPAGFKVVDVGNSLDTQPSSLLKEAAASTTQYWVCLAISESTFRFGSAQGGSESSTLAKAKQLCGKNDCNNSWVCIEKGCIGVDFGQGAAWITLERGYGISDATKAERLALSECQKYDYGCGRPGHFCAKYVI